MIKFLHAADLHLDSPLRGLDNYEGAPVHSIRSAARRALENLVKIAIDEKVQFVLLAGDIFDGDWQDVKTGLFFVNQLARLNERDIPVYVVSGNHDAASRMTRDLPYPRNVVKFATETAETITLNDIGIAVHGQGFADQTEIRNLAADFPEPVQGHFNIGLLHTSLDGREGHETYAPCQLNELIARGYDYWALGHIHKRESVNGENTPRVEFPGNIQGRHIREDGAKGCLLVEVDADRNIDVQFHALDVFRWGRLVVDCSGAEDRESVFDLVEEKLAEALDESDGRSLAVRVELTGRCCIHNSLLADLARIRDEIRAKALALGSDRIWVEKTIVRTTRPAATKQLEVDEDALSEIAEVIELLAGDTKQLQEIIGKDEIKNLNSKLPTEIKNGPDGVYLSDPAWMARFFDRVEAILSNSAAMEDSTQ